MKADVLLQWMESVCQETGIYQVPACDWILRKMFMTSPISGKGEAVLEKTTFYELVHILYKGQEPDCNMCVCVAVLLLLCAENLDYFP